MPSKSSSRGPGPNNSSKTASAKINGTAKPTTSTNASNAPANSRPPPVGVSNGNTSNDNIPSNQDLPLSNVEPKQSKGSEVDQTASAMPTVNRKKQKRREKQAARLAAAEPQNSTPVFDQSQGYVDASDTPYRDLDYAMSATQAQINANGYDYGVSDYDDPDQYEPGEGEDLYYTDEDDRLLEKSYAAFRSNGHSSSNRMPSDSSGNKAKTKKRTKSNAAQSSYLSSFDPNIASYAARSAMYQPPPPPPPPPLSTAALRSAHHISTDRIWNTSTAEERQRIKEFWLSLGEEDRRSLVKVEKDAVLKKMKEQQKHSCSCTVCGRKRTAIEEELEVLYDAYYEELEQYANHQQISLGDGTPIIPPPRTNGRLMPSGQQMPGMYNPRSSRGRIQEVTDDDEDGEEDEYSDEDDEDEISDGEPAEPMGPAADFFNFGNSLTVQGGILTVADDLLKNDGKKFIEMMEQLAERRMQREEEAQYASSRYPSTPGHNHGAPLDDDDDQEYDDEDDEEYDDSQEDDYEEEDDMGAMTEEQRIEEGRRMFQIFAARMFEQRVLTAYREKVARERQQKLIEELDEETRLDTQREAKKAKEAQKKKEKKRQQKQARDEEKAKRDAEKVAEEAALKAIEEEKLEEQRQKKEEQRKRREAEKKAQEEERQRKEAEKQRKAQQAREHQAELERKQREQKEREKKKREDAKKKEREEREAKEKELREKKEYEVAEKKEREAQAKAEKEEAERKRNEEQATKQYVPTAPAVPNLPSTRSHIPPVAAPQIAALQPLQTTSSHASPHLPIATPAIPKAPTPIRPRQASFQDSHSSSPKTSLPRIESSAASPSVHSQAHDVAIPPIGKAPQPPGPLQTKQQTPPFTPVSVLAGPPTQPPGLSNSPAISNGFPAAFGPILPNVTQRAPAHDSSMFPHPPHFNGNQYRPYVAPNGFPYPPGINGVNFMRSYPQGRGGPVEPQMTPLSMGPPLGSTAATHSAGPFGIPRENMPSHSHSRQSSATFERSHFENPSIPALAHPIARPAPIQRPPSTAPYQQRDSHRGPANVDIDDGNNHLGSSALLDDTDVPIAPNGTHSRRGSMAPGGPRSVRPGFDGAPGFQDPIGTAKAENFGHTVPIGNGKFGIAWNSPPTPSSGPPTSGSATWPNAPRPGRPSNAFGGLGGPTRPSGSRAVTIRLLVCQACSKLSVHPPADSRFGFHNVETVLRQVEMMKPANEGSVPMQEMLDICDTEGNSQNGGGSFVIENHEPNGIFVKFEPGRNTSMSMSGGLGPGDIGSPVPGGAMPAFGGGRGFSQGNIMAPSGF